MRESGYQMSLIPQKPGATGQRQGERESARPGGRGPAAPRICARPRGKVCTAARGGGARGGRARGRGGRRIAFAGPERRRGAFERARPRPPRVGAGARAVPAPRSGRATAPHQHLPRPRGTERRVPASLLPKSKVWGITEPVRPPARPPESVRERRARGRARGAGEREPIHFSTSARRAGGRSADLSPAGAARARRGGGAAAALPITSAPGSARPLPPARSLLPNCYP